MGSAAAPAVPGGLTRVYAPSSSSFFLCFGFLRSSLGTISRADGTIPTRSRASLRISFLTSNLGFFRAIYLRRAVAWTYAAKASGFPGGAISNRMPTLSVLSFV
jgi:hypothetical protein